MWKLEQLKKRTGAPTTSQCGKPRDDGTRSWNELLRLRGSQALVRLKLTGQGLLAVRSAPPLPTLSLSLCGKSHLFGSRVCLFPSQ